MKTLNCLPSICLFLRKPSKLTPTKTTILLPYTLFPPPLTPSMASQGLPEGRKATPASRPPPEQGLRCPRCDSSNTKFCYYNNYSLTQPRHFCKTCRRYWTKGGALRNVPIGGGCRKNKKSKAAASRASAVDDSDAGGLKFLHGAPSAVDFQLNGLPFSRLNSSSSNGVFGQFFTFGDLSSSMAGPSSSTPGANIDAGGAIASPPPLMGFRSYPIHSAVLRPGGIQEMGSNSMQNNIPSSIESLSSINQDLHLKLQQQRLAMMFGGSQRESSAGSAPGSASLIENQQLPISFQASESSKNGGCGVDTGNNPTGLFLETSYPTVSEMQSWSDIHHFS